MAEPAIEAYYSEDRTFPPPDGFAADALVSDRSLYDEAERDWEGFWARQARELVTWFDDFDTVCEWNLPFAKWFRRRHAERRRTTASTVTSRRAGATVSRTTGRASPATPAPSPTPTCTRRCAGSPTCSSRSGCEKGDRVNIYLPMIPELPVAMLACARIGAPHSVVFGGFSADALSDRINDAEAKVLDHRGRRLAAWRGGTAQGQRRRRPRQHTVDRARRRRAPHRCRRRT